MARFKVGHNVFSGSGRLATDPMFIEKTSKAGKQYLYCQLPLIINPAGRRPKGYDAQALRIQVVLLGKAAEHVRDVVRAGRGDLVWITGQLQNKVASSSEGKRLFLTYVLAWELLLQVPTSKGEREGIGPQFEENEGVDPFDSEPIL